MKLVFRLIYSFGPLVALCMQIEEIFPLEEAVVARLDILDSAADQDLTKYHSTIANMVACSLNLLFSAFLCVISKTV